MSGVEEDRDAAGGTVHRVPERPTGSFTGPAGRCTDSRTDTATDWTGAGVRLDHEKLVVYQVARELVEYVNRLLERKVPRELTSQLDRSTTSILSNIGEGAGKTARAEKRRYYEIARGSATEAATQLDILLIKRIIRPDEHDHAHRLIVRIVQMLSRMCASPRTK